MPSSKGNLRPGPGKASPGHVSRPGAASPDPAAVKSCSLAKPQRAPRKKGGLGTEGRVHHTSEPLRSWRLGERDCPGLSMTCARPRRVTQEDPDRSLSFLPCSVWHAIITAVRLQATENRMSGVQGIHDPGTAVATCMAAPARVEQASPGTGPKLIDRMREVLRSKTEGHRPVSMPDPEDPQSPPGTHEEGRRGLAGLGRHQTLFSRKAAKSAKE
jgi:hypothetical protein